PLPLRLGLVHDPQPDPGRTPEAGLHVVARHGPPAERRDGDDVDRGAGAPGVARRGALAGGRLARPSRGVSPERRGSAARRMRGVLRPSLPPALLRGDERRPADEPDRPPPPGTPGPRRLLGPRVSQRVRDGSRGALPRPGETDGRRRARLDAPAGGGRAPEDAPPGRPPGLPPRGGQGA